MDISYVSQQIEYARKNRTAVVFKNMFSSVPTWEQAINHLNYEYNNENTNIYKKYIDDGYFDKEESKQYGEIIKNGVLFYEGKDLFLSFQSRDCKKFYPGIGLVEDLFKNVLKDSKAKFGQVFINFVENENKMPMHIDQRETIFWLCQGNATWISGKDDNFENYEEFDIESGDILFAPFGLPHTVKSKSPRFAIVMAANYKDE